MSKLFSDLKIIFLTVCLFISLGIFPSESRWAYLLPEYIIGTEDSVLKKKLSFYDTLSFTGNFMDSRGNIHSSVPSEKIITRLDKLFPQKKFSLHPLLTFRSAKEAQLFLGRKEFFQTGAENILNFVQNKKYQGIHLDIENIPDQYSLPISEFAAKISVLLRKKNLLTSMAVFPEVEFRHSSLHNLNLLRESLDEIIIMAYDLHDRSTGAGCVTDLAWAEKNIKSTLQKFAPEKIRLGIPAYGYSWSEQISVVSAKQGKRMMKGNQWERDLSGCIRIKHSGKRKVTFFSDLELREKLSALALKYRLHGTALWRLGLEDE